MNKRQGLYIHIPFCKSICPYCGFTKMVASESIKDDYLTSLIREAELKNINNISFNTLYIGGGTPSSLSLKQLDYLLSNLSKFIDLENIEEFTIEANPLDIDDDFIKLIKKYHINRLSIGIESFNQKISKLINRVITIEDFNNLIKTLEDNNFDNYSFDLMYGFNGQSLEDIKNDIDIILKSTVKHISLYALIIEEKTVFNHLTNKGAILEANEDQEAEMYYFISSYLNDHGFYKYETSNFAIRGYESKHNLIYWNYDNYYSLGIGATQIVDGIEETMDVKITDYIHSLLNNNLIPNHYNKVLDKEQILFDYAMVNLRKTEGILKNNFKNRFNRELKEVYPKIDELLKKDFLREDELSIYINPEYRFVENSIIVEVLEIIKV